MRRVRGVDLLLVTITAVIVTSLAFLVTNRCNTIAREAAESRTIGQVDYRVVMVIDGAEVRRYENDQVVCFKVSTGYYGGDSIDCDDKPAPVTRP